MAESRRVALLARPGEACERLRAALREAGGDIVLEADPSTLEPQALRAAAVETVLVALDPAVEDALEKFDDVLSDRSVEVIFDEADLAARREGWDAARWVRHLSAKLHRHDDVLPPGREPDDELPAAEVSIEDAEDAAAFDEIEAFSVESDDSVAAQVELASDDDAEALDLDSMAFSGDVEAGGIELEGVDLGGIELAGIELGEVDLGEVAPSAFANLAFTDDINALDFDAGEAAPPADLPVPNFGADVQDFDALMRDLGGDAANAGDAGDADEPLPVMPAARSFAPVETLPGLDFDIAPVDAPTAKEVELAMPDFSSLSLEAVTDTPATATLTATDAPVAPKFKHDISDLERRIASLELVGEGAPATATKAEVASAPAIEAMPPLATPVSDARGAVLILAGIGGPDAVRQILTALPQGFRRAVLISQRLDGGRYDRLVQQMARAAAMPVHLAEAASEIAPGHVYILPPELGVEAAEGLRFSAGAPLLDALPADDTAVLLLSGADPSLVDGALAHAANGAFVAGQSPDGCYDAAAPLALTARGGTAATPQELVQSLLQRWPA